MAIVCGSPQTGSNRQGQSRASPSRRHQKQGVQTRRSTCRDMTTSSCEQSRAAGGRRWHDSWEEVRIPVGRHTQLDSRPEKKAHSQLTGNTTGMPPRTALDPSSMAFSLNHRCSCPAFVHEITVAPCSSTSTDSPVGRLAVTRELSGEMLTCGCGPVDLAVIAAGRCARSTILQDFVGECVGGVCKPDE